MSLASHPGQVPLELEEDDEEVLGIRSQIPRTGTPQNKHLGYLTPLAVIHVAPLEVGQEDGGQVNLYPLQQRGVPLEQNCEHSPLDVAPPELEELEELLLDEV